MKRSALVSPVLCAAVLAIGLYVLDRRDRSARAELEARIAALESARAAVPPSGSTRERRPVAAPAATPSEVEEDDSDRIEEPPRAPADEVEQARAAAEELIDRFEERFMEEGADPTWSERAAQALRAQVPSALPATSRVLDLACRSTLCRVLVEHEGMEGHNRFVEGLLQDPDSDLAQLAAGAACSLGAPTPDGRVRYAVYVVRRGYSMVPEGLP